jgi:hypothetical protein
MYVGTHSTELGHGLRFVDRPYPREVQFLLVVSQMRSRNEPLTKSSSRVVSARRTVHRSGGVIALGLREFERLVSIYRSSAVSCEKTVKDDSSGHRNCARNLKGEIYGSAEIFVR